MIANLKPDIALDAAGVVPVDRSIQSDSNVFIEMVVVQIWECSMRIPEVVPARGAIGPAHREEHRSDASELIMIIHHAHVVRLVPNVIFSAVFLVHVVPELMHECADLIIRRTGATGE